MLSSQIEIFRKSFSRKKIVILDSYIKEKISSG